MSTIRVFAIAGIAALLALPTYTIPVSFDDINRGPSASLEIAPGVTVTGATAGQNVATVAGVGLGAADFGAPGTLFRRVSFEAGTGRLLNNSGNGGLNITVDGKINSVTIDAYISVLTGQSAPPRFSVSDFGRGTESPFLITLHDVEPGIHTITFLPDNVPSSLDLGLGTEFGVESYFFSYLSSLGFPAVDLQYGYSVKSIDYTPTDMPDSGSSFCLLALGVVGLSFIGRLQPRMKPMSAKEG